MQPIALMDPEFQSNPHPALAEARREQPVFQGSDFPVFVLTRYDDVAAMRDENMYSTRFIKMLREPIEGPSMIQMDGKEHHRNRSLVATGFRPKFLSGFVDERVVPRMHGLIDELRPKGAAELMREFCERLPFWTIAELLGLEPDDQPRLSQLYTDMVAADPVAFNDEAIARNVRACEILTEMLRPVVERHKADPDAPGFLHQMINARTSEGEQLTEEEVYGFLRFLLPAGQDTTMSALGTLIYEILRRPEVREKLDGDWSLLGGAIEESLRWHAPISYVNRVTNEDQQLHGVAVPAGSLVLGAVNAANRDETVFDDADVFDITRDPNKHLTFGTGVHMCIGAPLARSTLRLAIPALFQALPNLRLAPGFEGRYAGLFASALTELPVEFD